MASGATAILRRAKVLSEKKRRRKKRKEKKKKKNPQDYLCNRAEQWGLGMDSLMCQLPKEARKQLCPKPPPSGLEPDSVSQKKYLAQKCSDIKKDHA